MFKFDKEQLGVLGLRTPATDQSNQAPSFQLYEADIGCWITVRENYVLRISERARLYVRAVGVTSEHMMGFDILCQSIARTSIQHLRLNAGGARQSIRTQSSSSILDKAALQRRSVSGSGQRYCLYLILNKHN